MLRFYEGNVGKALEHLYPNIGLKLQEFDDHMSSKFFLSSSLLFSFHVFFVLVLFSSSYLSSLPPSQTFETYYDCRFVLEDNKESTCLSPQRA